MANKFEQLEKKKTKTGKVYDAFEQAASNKGRQKPLSPQELDQRLSERRTQGRKGCKQPRISMTFSSDNYNFIKAGSAASGQTMVGFVNAIISSYREKHPELLEKANETLREFEKGLKDL